MTTEETVQQERDKIAEWLDCTKDCQYVTVSGECRRFNDLCSHYVAECIRRGEKP